MASPDPTHGLRPRPRDPYGYIVVGAVVSLIGAALLSAEIVIGPLLLVIGGPILFVGLTAQGVLVGMRTAQYFEYLDRTIEEAQEEEV